MEFFNYIYQIKYENKGRRHTLCSRSPLNNFHLRACGNLAHNRKICIKQINWCQKIRSQWILWKMLCHGEYRHATAGGFYSNFHPSGPGRYLRGERD